MKSTNLMEMWCTSEAQHHRKTSRRKKSGQMPGCRSLLLIAALLADAVSSACTHSSIPTVADQIVTLSQSVTVASMTHSGCPTLQYQVKTSPASLPGGASVTFTGAGPSVQVTQGTNIDSFAVSISHESTSGELFAYTAFMVHPVNPDASSSDYGAFCATNPTSCICASGTCPTVYDFCGSDFHMEPVDQPSALEYLIKSPASLETYQLDQFTFPSSQPDYGCPQDSYVVQVENPASAGSFMSHPDVTLDPSSLQMTISLSDEAYAGDTKFRLSFNGQNFKDFTVSTCHLPTPASIFADPTQDLNLAKQASPGVMAFADYSYVGGSTCGAYSATVSAVLPESWFTFDDTASAPTLTVDTNSSGVTTSEDFSVDFKVQDHFGGVVVDETFTVTVVDCSDLIGSGLKFNDDGPAEVVAGEPGDEFEWNLTYKTSYTMTILPTEYNIGCGAPIGQVITGNDPYGHIFANYAVVSTGSPLTIQFTLDSASRPMALNDEIITLDISDSNSQGVVVTTTLTIGLHLCAQPPLVDPAYVCRFYMNRGTGNCEYPKNTKMHFSCGNPLNFKVEDSLSSNNLISVGNLSWVSQVGNGSNHTLTFDFSDETDATMISMIGVYNAERLQSTITEAFQLVLCYFYEPEDLFYKPDENTYQLEYNRSKDFGVLTQTFEIKLSLFDMSTNVALCQDYFYALDNAETWTVFSVTPGGAEYNTITVTIESTTPVGEVEVTYRIESNDGTYVKEFPIKLKVVDCNELGQIHGNDLVSNPDTGNTDRWQTMYLHAVTFYSHLEFYWGEDTICGALRHVLTNSEGFDSSTSAVSPYIRYTTNVWEDRVIKVDLRNWDSGVYRKKVTVTITVDDEINDVTFIGRTSETFNLIVFNCLYEDIVTIPASATIFALADNPVTLTYDSDQLSAQDIWCYPLTMTILVEDSSSPGTWTAVESGVYEPSWITTIVQHKAGDSTSAPFYYIFTFEMALSNPMLSYKVKNHVTNAHGGPVTKESDEWWVHFYSAVINAPTGNIWSYPSRPVNDDAEFIFTRQQTELTQIQTFYLYDTRNTNVMLNDGSSDVDFVDYDTCCGMYSATVTTPTKNLVIDLGSMPVNYADGSPVPAASYTYATPTPIPDFFTDEMSRRVAVSDVFGNLGGYVPQLDNSMTVKLYDCAFDFPTPEDNLELIFDEENNASFDGATSSFRYQIDSGDYSLQVKILPPSWPDVDICGPQVVTMTVDAAGTDYISYTHDVSQDIDLGTGDVTAIWGTIDIIDDAVTDDIPPFTSEVYFTVKNDQYEVKLDAVKLLIEKFNCHAPKTFTGLPNVTPDDFGTIDVADKTDSTPPDWNWNWDPILFDDTFCKVQEYKVTCTDPDGVSFTVIPNNAGQSLCGIFEADTTVGQQLITIPDHSIVGNQHEGLYTFTVEGTNTLSLDNPGVYTFQLTVEPDCAITTITAPAEFSFANFFGTHNFIGINTFESGTWPTLTQFSLSVTTICQLSFHLVHSTDGGATYSESTVPSYIAMSPASGGTSQPFSVSIDGALTTNEQFTGEGDLILFGIEARVVGTTVSEMTAFNVIFFPNCLDTHVKIQDTIALSTQTVQLGLISDADELLISSDDAVLEGAVISNLNDDSTLDVFDKEACILKEQWYQIDVFSQTTDILSLDVQLATGTLEISTRKDVVNADVKSTSDACQLNFLGQVSCTIDYQIKVRSYNSTWTLAEGDIVFVSECLSLKSLYEATGSSDSMWQWPTKADFDKGYALRQPGVSFLLPQVFPTLTSTPTTTLSVFDECGPITYTVENPDYEIFSIDSATITADNSQPIKIMAQTFDTAKVMPLDATKESYQFKITVQIESFKDHADAVTYEYMQTSDLKFELRDFCREPTFTETSLIIDDPETLTDYLIDPAEGQIMMEKKILSTATLFYLTYLDYKTEEEELTGVKYPCGPPENILYETQPLDGANKIFSDVVSQSSSPSKWLTAQGLKYTFLPIYNDQANGAFYFTVKATVAEPVELRGTETIGSTLMSVWMRIKPCEVLEVIQGNQSFPNYSLLIGQDTQRLEFVEFEQVPACNYTMTYSLTIAAVKSSNFEDRTEGSRLSPPIATYNPSMLPRTIDFFSDNQGYVGTTFTVFVTGHALIDEDLQDPIFGVSDPFYIDFTEEPPEPPPRKPTISGFKNWFEIVAGSVERIDVGVPYDFQLRPVTVTWDFVSLEEDFISLEEERGSDHIYFKVSPPETSPQKKIELKLQLDVESADPPLRSTFYIEVWVIEKVIQDLNSTETSGSGLSVTESNQKWKPIDTLVSTSQVDNTGLIQITFSEEIIWPQDILEWSSSNEGSDFIEFAFLASEKTYDSLYYKELEMKVEWKLVKTSKKTLTIECDFSHAEIVSKFFNKGHIDFLEVKFLEKWKDVMMVTVKNKDEKHKARIVPQSDKNKIELTEITIGSVEGNVAVAVGINIFTTLVSAQVIQYLWGIINSLQLIVLTVLYSLLIPKMCFDVLIRIMKLTNLDLINVDFIFEAMFAFRETGPYNETFELAGYDTIIFFVEMGPLFFLVLIYLVWMPIRRLIRWCGEKTSGRNCLTRWMRKKQNVKIVIVRFFFEGCVEVGLSTFICISKITKDNFKEPWESISTGFALIIALIFLFFPIYLKRAKRIYLEETKAGVQDSWYADLFPDLKVKDSELSFTVFYFVRRYLMVISICMPLQNDNSQCLVHILMSLASLSYLCAVHPFVLPSRNYQEIMNETAVLVASYHLPIFTEWDQADELLQEYTGWSMLSIIVIVVTLNICLILFFFVKGVSLKCRRRKAIQTAKKRQIALQEAKVLEEAAEKEKRARELQLQRQREIALANQSLQEIPAKTQQEQNSQRTQVEAKLKTLKPLTTKVGNQQVKEEAKPVLQVRRRFNMTDAELKSILNNNAQIVPKLSHQRFKADQAAAAALKAKKANSALEKPEDVEIKPLKDPKAKIRFELSPIKPGMFDIDATESAMQTNQIKKYLKDFGKFLHGSNIPLKLREGNATRNFESQKLGKQGSQSLQSTQDNVHPTLGQGMMAAPKKHKIDLSQIQKPLFDQRSQHRHQQPEQIQVKRQASEGFVAEYTPTIPKLSYNFNQAPQVQVSGRSGASVNMSETSQRVTNDTPGEKSPDLRQFMLSPVRYSLFGLPYPESTVAASQQVPSSQNIYQTGNAATGPLVGEQNNSIQIGKQQSYSGQYNSIVQVEPPPRPARRQFIQLSPVKALNLDPVPELSHRQNPTVYRNNDHPEKQKFER